MTSFKIGFPFAVAILIAPFSAAAQQSISPTIDGILSVSYGQSDLDGTDLEREAFILDSTISLGNNVSIGVNADHVKNSVDESFTDFDVHFNRFQIEPTYHFGNNFYVGGFIQSASVSAISVDFDASGLFAGFDGEKWSAEAYAGRSDMNLGTFFGGARTTDSSLHGLSVSYSASENLKISAHVSQTNLTDIFGGGQHDLKSVAAFYKIGNGFSIHGALEKFESGMMAERTKTRAIGVGYNFAEAGISVPGTFMLEAERSEFGSFLETDTIIASWVVPFGKQTAKPLDSVARSSSGDIRTAYVAYLSRNILLGLEGLFID